MLIIIAQPAKTTSRMACILLKAKSYKPTYWDDFFDFEDKVTSDFMEERIDPPAQERELF